MRAFLHDRPAPTLLMVHGLLPYGLMMCKFYLAFHRAGFNVVNADLPGFGLSGGARGGPTIDAMIRMWRDVKAFALRELGEGPLFVVGTAEDSVTAYYAFANDPDVDALSLHVLLEYGDVENLHWKGNRAKIRAMMLGARIAHAAKLDLPFDAVRAVPWEEIIEPHVDTLRKDPLAITAYSTALAATMAKPMPPPVPFEECRTPCQMLVSEKSRLWPLEHNRRAYERLGSPKKEWVLIEGAPQWSLRDEFVETYTGNVIRWFGANGSE